MIIKDKYKDYYDYLAHTYCVDNNVVFNREKEIEMDYCKIRKTSIRDDLLNSGAIDKSALKILRYLEWNSIALIVLGKLFLLHKPYVGKNYLGSDVRGELCVIKELTEESIQRGMNSWRYLDVNSENIRDKFNLIQGLYSDSLYQINKDFGVPYMIVNHWLSSNVKDIYVWSDVPLLQAYGLPSIIPADELYKGIYNFFIEINENKDLEPPIPLSDKDKIHKAGFDVKQSFRKRKE